ncbi:MAG: hypothetical protein WA432_04340 [Candidatus Babeliaceae bacterium]
MKRMTIKQFLAGGLFLLLAQPSFAYMNQWLRDFNAAYAAYNKNSSEANFKAFEQNYNRLVTGDRKKQVAPQWVGKAHEAVTALVKKGDQKIMDALKAGKFEAQELESLRRKVAELEQKGKVSEAQKVVTVVKKGEMPAVTPTKKGEQFVDFIKNGNADQWLTEKAALEIEHLTYPNAVALDEEMKAFTRNLGNLLPETVKLSDESQRRLADILQRLSLRIGPMKGYETELERIHNTIENYSKATKPDLSEMTQTAQDLMSVLQNYNAAQAKGEEVSSDLLKRAENDTATLKNLINKVIPTPAGEAPQPVATGLSVAIKNARKLFDELKTAIDSPGFNSFSIDIIDGLLEKFTDLEKELRDIKNNYNPKEDILSQDDLIKFMELKQKVRNKQQGLGGTPLISQKTPSASELDVLMMSMKANLQRYENAKKRQPGEEKTVLETLQLRDIEKWLDDLNNIEEALPDQKVSTSMEGYQAYVAMKNDLITMKNKKETEVPAPAQPEVPAGQPTVPEEGHYPVIYTEMTLAQLKPIVDKFHSRANEVGSAQEANQLYRAYLPAFEAVKTKSGVTTFEIRSWEQDLINLNNNYNLGLRK